MRVYNDVVPRYTYPRRGILPEWIVVVVVGSRGNLNSEASNARRSLICIEAEGTVSGSDDDDGSYRTSSIFPKVGGTHRSTTSPCLFPYANITAIPFAVTFSRMLYTCHYVLISWMYVHFTIAKRDRRSFVTHNFEDTHHLRDILCTRGILYYVCTGTPTIIITIRTFFMHD